MIGDKGHCGRTPQQEVDEVLNWNTPAHSNELGSREIYDCRSDNRINQDLYVLLNKYTSEVVGFDISFDKFVDDGGDSGVGLVSTRIVSHVFTQWQQTNSLISHNNTQIRKCDCQQQVIELLEKKIAEYNKSAHLCNEILGRLVIKCVVYELTNILNQLKK